LFVAAVLAAGLFVAQSTTWAQSGPYAAQIQRAIANLTNGTISYAAISGGTCGVPTATVPFYFCTSVVGNQSFQIENADVSASSFEQVTYKNGTTFMKFGVTNQNAAAGFEGAGRAWFELPNLSGAGIDFGGPHASTTYRFSTGGETTSQ